MLSTRAGGLDLNLQSADTVESQLPEKTEYVIKCDMSALQRTLAEGNKHSTDWRISWTKIRARRSEDV
ncbi:hypothetical protein niasHT_031011 [Heterodera trifolii]|uniref:Uncharacterized protein n=1 Tax=Heterodera trifolii TaxID=157864 RepID=A0ABD2IH47_9BILA